MKYQDELSKAIQLYNIPEAMYYNPKMLSLTLYGTTELWLGLLRVNNMKNVTEFHKPFIKIYNPYVSLLFISPHNFTLCGDNIFIPKEYPQAD